MWVTDHVMLHLGLPRRPGDSWPRPLPPHTPAGTCHRYSAKQPRPVGSGQNLPCVFLGGHWRPRHL